MPVCMSVRSAARVRRTDYYTRHMRDMGCQEGWWVRSLNGFSVIRLIRVSLTGQLSTGPNSTCKDPEKILGEKKQNLL